MSDHFIGVTTPGAHVTGVLTGTSTISANVELRIHDGVTGLNKTAVLLAIETIKNHVTTANAPV
jgi:hypothetical protein